MSYVVTPRRYAEGLETIEAAARDANRTIERFDSAHLLFVRIDDRRDRALDDATAILSRRYAMDFRRAAERYCALGHPDEVAATVNEFLRAGVRHVILDLLGDWDESRPQPRAVLRGGQAEAPDRRRLTNEAPFRSRQACTTPQIPGSAGVPPASGLRPTGVQAGD